MFIYFVGLILASYVRSVWQKDDVLRKKISSTEAVLAEMRTIRCIEHTGKMKVITPFVGSQVAWNENMHIETCFHRGTAHLSLRIDKKSGRTDRNEKYKCKFDDPNAEMDGISRLLRSN